MLLNIHVFCFFVFLINLNCVISSILLEILGHKLENETRRYNLQYPSTIISSNHTPMMELIEKHNYSVESHEVTTEDGYILTVHRIPKQEKPVVLFCHGLLASSASWVIQGPKKDLAFLMSDKNYDVWMINLRGSTYSRKHISLDPDKDKKFWEYSFHEMGFYDMPATIDYILNKTNEKSLIFIGHSMGNAVFFVMTTMKPEYNNKIKIMHGLSPAVFLIHPPNNLMQILLANGDSLIKQCKEENVLELLPMKKIFTQLGTSLCNDNSLTQNLCIIGLSLFMGIDYPQMNKTLLPLIFQHFPAGTSINTFAHFFQNIKTASFRPLDYGLEENKIRYQRESIFDYDMKKATAPVMLYYGDGDYLVTKEDTEMLARRLPNSLGVYRVPFPFFNHIDFLLSVDAKNLLYDTILRITKKYRNL